MSPPTTEQRSWLAGARKGALPVVLWAFGFATSLMLLGLWGRTVAIDSPTIEEAAQTIVDSDLATERVHEWLEEGIAVAAQTDALTAAAVADIVASDPKFSEAVDLIVSEFVAGLFAEPGEDPTVHIEEALAPLIPVAVEEANRYDVAVDEAQIEQALDAASVIQLDTGEAATVAAVVDEARAVLTRVVVVAAIALTLTATLALLLAERRFAMLRTLSTRVLLSAATYALLFRVAAWALDPERGRTPVLGGGSVLLGSNGHVFTIAGVAAALIATWGGVIAWRRGRTRQSEPLEDRAQDDTRELVVL